MLIDFFYSLRAAKLPVSVKELLTLLECLQADVVGPRAEACSLDDFYFLARTVLVKDEKHFDRFDRAFGAYFHGVEQLTDFSREIPADWLRQQLERLLSAEQKANAPKLDWDELMDTLQKRLEEEQARHEGDNKWIGTGGTSPFGHGGHNPQGIRIGGQSRNRSAVKVWEQRAYRDYDDSQELGTRHIKLALRRLRQFARNGNELELDLPGTIRATAANAGWLDLRMVPERHNSIKVLLLMDVGGSMDDHVKQVEFYYFHNCVYDHLWRHNQRRHAERIDTWDLIRKYPRDYKLVFVGDATMSPYEILQPHGSVEYNNPEPGAEWLQRLTDAFPHCAWINPEPQGVWQYRQSVDLIRQLMGNRMYPLTLQGLEQAMRQLMK